MPARSQTLVTVGLPCYNEQRYVMEAVRGILAQKFQDWELIIVDDGSVDGTPEILRRLRHSRIRVEIDGKHLGLAARLNQIARAAKGKYIARMDADDVAHPERLQRQIECLEAHPEIEVLGTAMAIVDCEGHVVAKRVLPAEPFADPRNPVIAHATIVCRTEWMLEHPYNESNTRCEDWELWRSAGKVAARNLGEPLYFYREFDSFSLRTYLERQLRMMRLLAHDVDLKKIGSAVLGCGAYAVAAIAGMTDRLIARRSVPIPGAERDKLQSAYESVLAVDLEEAQEASLPRNAQ